MSITTPTYKAIHTFRKVAVIEGISFLVLVFLAMPLKYWANWPLGVKYVGMAHGLLFVAYLITLIPAATQGNWSFKKSLWAFVASLFPFGTFILDKQLKREYA